MAKVPRLTGLKHRLGRSDQSGPKALLRRVLGCDLVQRARFAKQVGRARNDVEPVLAVELVTLVNPLPARISDAITVPLGQRSRTWNCPADMKSQT